MQLTFDADYVWSVGRGGATAFTAQCDGVVTIEIAAPAAAVHHYKFTALRWTGHQCEIIGGVVIAVGDPRYEPTGVNTHAEFYGPWKLGRRTTDDLELKLLTRESETTPWFRGVPVVTGTLRVAGDRAFYWDVSNEYAKWARIVIDDMLRREVMTFVNNPAFHGTLANQRGLIRHSELRFDFPGFASPGCCIEETTVTRYTVQMWDVLVRLVTQMLSLDSPLPQDSGQTDDVRLANVYEALATAVLGLAGVIGGYYCETLDDTSTTFFKLWTNEDCDGDAFTVVGLFNHLMSCDFGTTAATSTGRALARLIPIMFTSAVAVTGHADPAIAQPRMLPADDHAGGHAWCMLKRAAGWWPKEVTTVWVVVECTTVVASYTRTAPFDPTVPPSALCAEAFAGRLSITVPHVSLLRKPTAIGRVLLMSLDDDNTPFKYLTVGTMATATSSDSVCLPGTYTMGVPMTDVIHGVFDRVPSASDKAIGVYDAFFRDFRYDWDPDTTPLPVAEHRQLPVMKGEPARSGHVLYTADDYKRRMLGHFDLTPDAGLTATSVHTPFGDLILAGYKEAPVVVHGEDAHVYLNRV
jgi:hypothetical protein